MTFFRNIMKRKKSAPRDVRVRLPELKQEADLQLTDARFRFRLSRTFGVTRPDPLARSDASENQSRV